MKAYLLALGCCFLMGCEYTVPLLVTPQHPIDPSLVGQWQRTSSNDPETVLVLPWSDQEYLVVFPANKPNAMYARATLTPVASIPLLQLKWFGTAQGDLPTDPRVYQFVTFSRQDDRVTVRLLNSEVISKSISTSDALMQAIIQNKDKPNLFQEPMYFSRIAETKTK